MKMVAETINKIAILKPDIDNYRDNLTITKSVNMNKCMHNLKLPWTLFSNRKMEYTFLQ